jgi:cyclohexanone monooxygenase
MTDIDVSSVPAEELRKKYEEERLKRVRAEGNAQYVELKQYKDFDADPYTPLIPREPLDIETDALIVGAGWGGMTAAAYLRKNGVDDFRIIDKAGDFGGTWYWNRYPGCMCDVESYCYLPLLEETGFMPTKKYAHASEIFEYAQLLGRKYDMYENAIFQTEVVDAVWDEAADRWRITTNRGDKIAARFFVIAGGVLHKAKLPGIPGIRDFEGHAFHTSRWDYSITGGGPEEPMDKLGDKVVGIIGTGATAVQAVPKLAEAAKHLYVFQRTPSMVGVRAQRDTDPEWFREMSSKPGWQQERIDNFTGMITGKKPEVDMVADGWTALLGDDTKRPPVDEEDAKYLERLDFAQMQKVRDRVDEIVKDKDTAEKLKPWYKVSCKRPCFHDDYLPAFNRDNVTLVDTDGHGVERITENSVVANGQEYPVDVLIYASGFEVLTFYTHRLGFDPKGTDGVSMSEAWAKGPSTLFGIHTHGFPNMLMNSAIQGGQDYNFAFTLTQTGKQIAYTIAEVLKRGATKCEPVITAESEWFDVIMGTLAAYGAYFADCTPSYLNNESAAPSEYDMKCGCYMGSALDWVKILEAWRERGDLNGLQLSANA